MTYRLLAEETLPDGIKRIAREQIDRALVQLIQTPEGVDEAVHDARKRFKKIRAVLRLVRDEIGEEVYRAENLTFRDAGRLLSPVRDSLVMVQTLADVIGDSDLVAEELAPARERLHYAHAYQREQLIERERALERVTSTIRAARARVEDWPVTHNDFSAVASGLKRVYRRGRNRMGDAYDHPVPERFHEWRKRVKYLWYHTRILRLLWDDPLDEVADATHDLADTLGDAHDLAELHAQVEGFPETSHNPVYQRLLGVLVEQRIALERAAYPVACRIYAEKPGRFVKRMGVYWDAWQAGARSV